MFSFFVFVNGGEQKENAGGGDFPSPGKKEPAGGLEEGKESRRAPDRGKSGWYYLLSTRSCHRNAKLLIL
jgi:hypothetical protein